MSEPDNNRTTVRVFAILEAIADAGPDGLRLTDICKVLAAHKSTTSRILATLTQLRVVEQDETGRFRLGITMLRLGLSVHQSLDLRARARSTLQRLVEQTGETIHMAVPEGSRAVYVEKLEGTNAYQMRSRIGTTMPLYCTGVGKAILAFMPEPERLARLPATPVARTAHTIVDLDELAHDLERTRLRGHSMDLEENEDGVRCVGAPVFDHEGRVAAGISIAGPAFQFTEERMLQLGAATVSAAAEVSRELGWEPTSSRRPVDPSSVAAASPSAGS